MTRTVMRPVTRTLIQRKYELHYVQMLILSLIVVYNRVPAKKAEQTDETDNRKLF